MARLLAKRLVQSCLILIGVAAITFVLLYALPADPARMLAGRSATAQTVENIRRELGLDQPLLTQFLHYLGNLVQGDLGRSYTQKTEVMTLILAALMGAAMWVQDRRWSIVILSLLVARYVVIYLI